MRLYKALNVISKIEKDLAIPTCITIRLFIRKVYNFLVFKDVIFGFYGWDYDYTLQILRRCLIEQYKEIRDEDIIAEPSLEETLLTLKTAIIHLNRFLNVTDSIEDETIKETGYKHVPIKFVGNILHCFENEEEKTEFDKYIAVRNKKEQDSWQTIWDTIKKSMPTWWS